VPHFGDYRPEAKEPPKGSEEWEQAQEMKEYEELLAEAIEEAGDAFDLACLEPLRSALALSGEPAASLPAWAQPWRQAA
jgi:hypothetical protein